MCLNEITRKVYAMKVINKKKLARQLMHTKQKANNMLETEMAVLKKINHPNVLECVEILDDASIHKLYLITELAKNGTLREKIEKETLTQN